MRLVCWCIINGIRKITEVGAYEKIVVVNMVFASLCIFKIAFGIHYARNSTVIGYGRGGIYHYIFAEQIFGTVNFIYLLFVLVSEKAKEVINAVGYGNPRFIGG